MAQTTIPVKFHPTQSFLEDLDPLTLSDGAKAARVRDALGQVLERLKKEGPGIAQPHGISGTNFCMPLSDGYILIFTWATDRTGEGKPLKEHLYLLSAEEA